MHLYDSKGTNSEAVFGSTEVESGRAKTVYSKPKAVLGKIKAVSSGRPVVNQIPILKSMASEVSFSVAVLSQNLARLKLCLVGPGKTGAASDRINAVFVVSSTWQDRGRIREDLAL